VGSDENFRFAHEDFRYYFLATHLLDEIQNIGSQPEIPLVRQRIQDSPDVWAEPIQMICDMVVENDKGNIQRVRGLLEDLLGEYEPGEPEAPEPAFHTDAVVLAARIASAQEITSKHDRRLIKQLVQWLAALLQTTNDLKQRAELGRMLGALGDPRPGIDLPSMQWVDVPAGSALVGGYHADDPYKTDDDSKRTLIELPGFQIGRYPVTVAQYEAFVNDGGYQQDEYWVEGEDRSGLIWRQDRQHPTIGWHDPLWHIPNHPVIGVTWYEASAFCRWFSAKTGTPVSLPTVAQWIWAARGDSDRIFPYGNTFDPARGNSYLSGIGRTTAVGLFARNGEPTDLSGNVYEWCQDAVPEKRLDDKRVLHYILMGGSWSSYPGFCRIDARYKDNPAFATPYWGFRIVK
jgi:formylglycine-generating enzyme required for sulfatase activity